MTPAQTIPLTQSQHMMWLGQKLAGGAPLYNMAWRFDLKFALDPERFAAAFTHAARSLDVLRTRLTGPLEAPEQMIDPDTPGFPAWLDFSAESDPYTAATDWTQQRAGRAIDLERSTFDTCLIKLSDTHWIWFFNQHHIATDAWSGSLIFKAVSEAYLALSRGDHGTLEAPSFADFAVSIQTVPASDDYWTTKADSIGPGNAPYGQTRDLSIAASLRETVPLGKARMQAVNDLISRAPFRSLSRDLSIFSVLMTVYSSFLARISDQETITIGTPSHNRATPTHKATAGLFIEMFPLSVTPAETDSFADVYQQVMHETLAFLRHAKPGTSTPELAGTFNAILNYIPVKYGQFAGQDTAITWLHPGAHDARHDLRLHVYDFEETGDMNLSFDFNSHVFDAPSRKDAIAHFLNVFDAFVANPDACIHEVPLTPNAPPAIQGKDVAPSKLFLDRFEAQVGAAPDAVACELDRQVLTYAALDALSSGYARAISERGVLAGEPVILHARRSPDLVAALIGVLKSGAYFIPVAADTPSARVAMIKEQSGAKLTITDAGMAGEPDLVLGQIEPAAFGRRVIDPEAPAYAIFTSGSTGTPKGVLVGHQGFADYANWANGAFGPIGPKDFPLYSSIAFDLTLTSIAVPLISGGRIVVYPDQAGTDLSVLDVFQEDRVDVVKLTPSHLSLVCARGGPVERISTLVLGGENLSVDLSRRALDVLGPDITIANEYGPTEAVVGCMIHRFDPAQDQGASVPIGAPSDGVTIHILDKGHNPVPELVTGEIYIGDDRLAKGYLGRDDLTSERFLPDPFTGGRMYRTGDLARRDREGVVHYLGRSDTQVKIGGVRIEPAEIETALLDQPAIREAFVTTFTPKRAQPRPVTVACTSCGVTDQSPDVDFSDDGVCSICREFEAYKDRANAYFRPEPELAELVAHLPMRKTGKYDAIVLLSGGKDSTYALYRFAELTQNILALTLDNGFISEGAKTNIRRVVDDLGIDHRFMTTPSMNDIFKDSLTRHSNVCQGCFKTIYTLALQTARAEGIPAVVTGLSRGQFFETRLTPELFVNHAPKTAEIEDFVLNARKSYHRMDDVIAQKLGTQDFFDDKLFEDIELIDIYRYIDVPVQEIYDFLSNRAPWIRPGDTGRSTNCLINDVGIHVHKRREGFHNYALPYSWDVRMGHKTRDEAMEELDDEIDEAKVGAILDEIGFDKSLLDPEGRPTLVAYVAGDAIDTANVMQKLRQHLPAALVPSKIIVLDAIPLTGNGKVDTGALPNPEEAETSQPLAHQPPETDTEHQLVRIYQSVIGADRIGVTDNFYDMGGDSIAAIQIAMLASEQGLDMEPNAVFEHQTIRELARSVPETSKPTAPIASTGPLIELGAGDLDALARQLSGVR